jgi:uncharacterized protein (TIGR02145 family)
MRSEGKSTKKSGISLPTGLFIVILLVLVTCSEDNPAGPTIKVPTLTTAAVSAITQTTAQCGGNVTSNGGATVTARGVCWSESPTPTVVNSKTTDGTGTGNYTSSMTSLAAGTTYYVRAYATNSVGTGYGEVKSFQTESSGGDSTGTVTDVDGNVYPTIKIGSQWWMGENLKVTHYRNGALCQAVIPGSRPGAAEISRVTQYLYGDPIPNVTDDGAWSSLSTGGYCNYDNDENNGDIYGKLYNWYAVADSREIAPPGWHVPTDEEWQTLVDFAGGELVAGGILKEVGTAHWLSPNTDATDQIGFTALPGGYRLSDGIFSRLGINGVFWSCTEDNSNSNFAWYRSLFNSVPRINHLSDTKQLGFSVRCVRD